MAGEFAAQRFTLREHVIEVAFELGCELRTEIGNGVADDGVDRHVQALGQTHVDVQEIGLRIEDELQVGRRGQQRVEPARGFILVERKALQRLGQRLVDRFVKAQRLIGVGLAGLVGLRPQLQYAGAQRAKFGNRLFDAKAARHPRRAMALGGRIERVAGRPSARLFGLLERCLGQFQVVRNGQHHAAGVVAQRGGIHVAGRRNALGKLLPLLQDGFQIISDKRRQQCLAR